MLKEEEGRQSFISMQAVTSMIITSSSESVMGNDYGGGTFIFHV